MARWEKLSRRGNVVDRRGMGTPRMGGAPGMAIGGLGGVGLIIFLVITLLGGGSPLDDVTGQLQPASSGGEQSAEFEGEDDYEVFTELVLGSTDETWSGIYEGSGLTYQLPTLVLFRTATESGCGGATSAIGPHYCPLDQTIYLDETFYDELTARLGAQGGDVAEAYVLAHEVGHHVQNLLGVLGQVQEQQQAAGSQEAANELSVRLELQADCFAGVWANSIRDEGVFLPGEIEEALDAAAAVGDDRIQEAATGQINPESWTHGSSEQRVQWFNTGFDSGDPSACNTFG